MEMASLTPYHRCAVHFVFLWVESCETSKFQSTGLYYCKEIAYVSFLNNIIKKKMVEHVNLGHGSL
jgi:hypothetical protein